MTKTHVTALLAAVVLLGTLSPLEAHGGRYRGRPPQPYPGVRPVKPGGIAAPKPAQPAVPTPTPGVPRPGPTTPPAQPGPTTPRGTALGQDATRWQLWWEMNKDQYLFVKSFVRQRGPVTGGDEFFLGPTRRELPTTELAPHRSQVRNKILPALLKALNDSNHPDLVTSCLVGLAKIGEDSRRGKLVDVFRKYLKTDNQEVRETAALALGVSRQRAALPILRELVLDTPTGRRLVDKGEVGDRVRSLATYGLGVLIANGTAPTRRMGFDILARALQSDSLHSRDVRVALINAIGAMDLDPVASSNDKRLLWQALPLLDKEYRRGDGRSEAVVRAHVPVAIGRLLGRGTSADHDRYRRMFAAQLAGKKRWPNELMQSAVIALGLMGKPEHKDALDALHQFYTNGRDQQARYFSLIAMGEIGGDRNRARLLKVLGRGKKSLERPWAALALGVYGYRARHARNGTVDDTVGRALEQQLLAARNKDAAGAFAIALGMSGYSRGMPSLRKLLEGNKNDGFVGFLCLGLGLGEDRGAIGAIQQIMHRATRRPMLLRQAAIALGRLQDKSAARHLIELIDGPEKNTARMAAAAGALAFIGDRRTVDALLKQLEDDEHTKLARAFVAAALGGIADPMLLPFAARYSMDANYRAVVETLTNESTGILDIL